MSDTGSTGPGSSSSDPGNFEALEQRLLQSPTARARFLADTLELLEKNGVDVNSPDFQQQIQPSLDLTEGSRFLGGLAASTVVVAVATAGQRGLGGMLGRQESTQGGVQGSVQGGFTVTVPAAATIADVARGLRALADLLINESEALDQQIQQLAAASGGTRGSESGT